MFGNRLKLLREEKGLSQKDLATSLNVGHSTITKWERNERQPDYNNLIRIADYFHVSTDYLLDRFNSDTPELVVQIFSLTTALDKELQIDRSLPESVEVYKNYKTKIDRLFLDLLSFRLGD